MVEILSSSLSSLLLKHMKLTAARFKMTCRGKPGGRLLVASDRRILMGKERTVTSETGQRSWEELRSLVTRIWQPI